MQIKIQCFCIIFIVATTWGNSIEERIADLKYECSTHANSIEENLHPWVTFIPLKTRTYNPGANVQCIGALISKRYVITASTCLQFVVSEVFLGHNDSNTLSDMVRAPVKHWTTYDKADVALLKLGTDIQFSDTVKPICLPFQEYGRPISDTILNVVSWTREAGSTLVSKKINEGTVTRCKSSYQVCLHPTGKQVACYGDEGSPITHFDGSNWVLHGILLSVFDSDGSPCARSSPAVGLKITDDIVDWIVEKMDD
uniref:Peptidase S1 domain-containing protein n=1 Tax=Photinus pyralis TaxID=7054 RepID=A0A1Y1LIW4_PHOPY